MRGNLKLRVRFGDTLGMCRVIDIRCGLGSGSWVLVERPGRRILTGIGFSVFPAGEKAISFRAFASNCADCPL